LEPVALEELSRLIGDIYDTVINPESWPAVLDKLSEYIGASRALLILEDAIEPTKSIFYLSFDDPDWVQSYLDTYLLLNPMRLANFGQVEAGMVLLTTDMMTAEEYARSRFAREFLAQRQMIDVAVAVLEATATTITVISFLRSQEQGIADETVRERLALLAPHVRRAATIGRLLNRRKLETSELSEALDSLDGAIFLLDKQATVLHCNRGARLLLANHPDAISILGGRVRAATPQARDVLDDALARASQGDDALGTTGLAIIFGGTEQKALVGTLMSLVDGSRRAVGGSYRAVAALFVRELQFDSPASVDVLRSHYGLTPREMTVVAGVVELGGVPQIASVMGLTDATVRTHLKAIFRKTGTSRQADLVKLVASTASPFRRA
jgi:DNA-binding CsgD family transcriptional regulator/PAS domain-containing protein